MLYDDQDPNFREHVGQFASEFDALTKARSLVGEGQAQKRPGRASQPEEVVTYRAAPGVGNSKYASVTECNIDVYSLMPYRRAMGVPSVGRREKGRRPSAPRPIRSRRR